MVVCHEAQETQGTQQTRVYFTGVKKTPFSHIWFFDLTEKFSCKHWPFCPDFVDHVTAIYHRNCMVNYDCILIAFYIGESQKFIRRIIVKI